MDLDRIQLTPEQQNCVEYRGTVAKDLVIQGIAGSGKSTVLMARAKQYIVDEYIPGKRNQVIIFTYNNTLASYIREYINKKYSVDNDILHNIKICTLDSYLNEVFQYTPGRFGRYPVTEDWLEKWCMEKALDNHKDKYGYHRFHSIGKSFWIEECQWIMNMNISIDDEEDYLLMSRTGRGGKVRMSAADRVVAFQIYREYIAFLKEKNKCAFAERYLYLSHNLHKISESFKYDHVLIDEAQDQSLAKMMVVAALSKKDVTISMDMNQRIYKQTWSMSQLGLKSITKTLKIGFRCSSQNDALAESLRMHNPNASQEHAPARGKDYGCFPLIKTLGSDIEQKRYFLNTVQEWKKQDPTATIGVLYVRNSQGIEYGSWLTERNIPFEFIKTDSYFSAIDPGVKLATIYSAKGLEFDHVIMLDFNEGIIPNVKSADPELAQEEMIKFRNLAYVAITRARARLLICTHTRPSSFIKEMDKSFYVTSEEEVKKEGCFYQVDTVGDNMSVKAYILENKTETTVKIDLKKYPKQQVIIGKKIGDTYKITGIPLTYEIIRIYSSEKPKENGISKKKTEENREIHNKVNSSNRNNIIQSSTSNTRTTAIITQAEKSKPLKKKDAEREIMENAIKKLGKILKLSNGETVTVVDVSKNTVTVQKRNGKTVAYDIDYCLDNKIFTLI